MNPIGGRDYKSIFWSRFATSEHEHADQTLPNFGNFISMKLQLFALVMWSLVTVFIGCSAPSTTEQPEYIEVDRLLVVPHRAAGIVGIRRPVRAWMETMEQGTTAPSRLAFLDEELGIRGIDISLDGKTLAFAQAVPMDAQDNEPPAGYVFLKSCNIKGLSLGSAGRIALTVGSYLDIDPCFDIDGRHLILCSNRRRRRRADLLRIGSGGRSGIEDVYVNTLEQIVLNPSMAKDGTICLCLYPGGDSQEPPQIWTIGGPDGYPTQVGVGLEPRISPDGTRIAFIGPDRNLWVMDRSGGGKIQLTSNAAEIAERFHETLSPDEQSLWTDEFVEPYSAPSWTPNGESILYSSMDSLDSTGRPNQDIWIMNSNGIGKKQLTANGSLDTYPVCSPDGRFTFFVSNRGGRWAIWRIEMPRAQE